MRGPVPSLGRRDIVSKGCLPRALHVGLLQVELTAVPMALFVMLISSLGLVSQWEDCGWVWGAEVFLVRSPGAFSESDSPEVT